MEAGQGALSTDPYIQGHVGFADGESLDKVALRQQPSVLSAGEQVVQHVVSIAACKVSAAGSRLGL